MGQMTDKKRVNIYDRFDHQLRCMYAECCGCIRMCASALCIHAGMSSCSAHPSFHPSIASARLSVCLCVLCLYRLVLVFNLTSVYLSDSPSICMSVCMYLHLYLCRDEHTSVCTMDREF